jgi:hypothetical protein
MEGIKRRFSGILVKGSKFERTLRPFDPLVNRKPHPRCFFPKPHRAIRSWANYYSIVGCFSCVQGDKERIDFSMQSELVNLLDKSEFIGLKVLEAVGFFATLWIVFAKHFGLKDSAVRLARIIIKMNEPELPKRKRSVRSGSKKPFDNRRS